MITRAKLVEQLREYQIRSQHKYSALTFFSPKPQIRSWADVSVALLLSALFSFLVVSSLLALYFTLLAFFCDCMSLCSTSHPVAQFSKIICKEEGKKNAITFVHVNINIQSYNQSFASIHMPYGRFRTFRFVK